MNILTINLPESQIKLLNLFVMKDRYTSRCELIREAVSEQIMEDLILISKKKEEIIEKDKVCIDGKIWRVRSTNGTD